MPKSIYLNDSVIEQIERINLFFGKFEYKPSDIGIISAALEVYEKRLNNFKESADELAGIFKKSDELTKEPE